MRDGFTQAEQVCKNYKKVPQALVPEGVKVPRYINVDLCSEPQGAAFKLTGKTILRLNHKHLFSLTKFADLPQLPWDLKTQIDADSRQHLKYILNTHFTNQDVQFSDFQSLQRTFLFSTNDDIEEVIDFINSKECAQLAKV